MLVVELVANVLLRFDGGLGGGGVVDDDLRGGVGGGGGVVDNTYR